MTNEGAIDRVGQARDVTAVDVDGVLSLFVPSSQQIVLLNKSASAVWALCDGVRSEAGVVETLALGSGVGADEIRDDVRVALASLVEVGALLPVAEP